MRHKKMTDQQIVDRANDLARQFYDAQGYTVKPGFRFDLSCHPHERGMWRLACIAFEELAATDPDDAISNLPE